MQEKSSAGSEEASAGGMADRRQQQMQAMRIRTFTRWMNLLLQKCDPPLMVRDLLAEVRDGQVLMALLEQLSGCKLLYRFRSSPQRIFRLNNISKVLSFLDDRHVKLPGVDLSGITDGVPAVVLNLIWSIILHFQVKPEVRALKGYLSPSRSSSRPGSRPSEPPHRVDDSSDSGPTGGRRADVEPKPHGKTIQTLLQLVQLFTSRFGVQVQDFGQSWSSGMAVVALIKSINPALVDLGESLSSDPRRSIQLAFEMAHRCLDIPPLLESEDLLCASPDELCIITYVSMFLRHYSPTEDCAMNADVPEIPNTESPEPISLGETLAHDPEAQALLKGLGTGNEQLLWKKWSSRSLGVSEQPASRAATSLAGGKRSTVNPPSPLDTGVSSQDIQSWMKEAERTYRKRRAGGNCLSLSSEEGIYSLSALDSEDEEEEEAASHILDLTQQVFPPLAPRTRLEVDEMAKSEALEKHERKEDESGCRGMVGSAGVFDSRSEAKNKSQREECGVVKAPRNDGGSRCCEDVTENAGLVTHRCDKTPSEAAETREMDAFEAQGRRKEPRREQSGRGPHENCEAASETAKEDDSLTALGGARDEMGKTKRHGRRREGKDDRGVCEVTGAGGAAVHTEQQRDGKVKADDLTSEGREGEGHSGGAKDPIDLAPITGAEERTGGSEAGGSKFQTAAKNVHVGDTLWPQTRSATDQPLRERGFTLEASVARCDITPLELQTLLALWIGIYCCFILHQMNS